MRRLHVCCPACQLRCTYNEPDKAICGAGDAIIAVPVR
jgi:hypothetical protein